VETPLKGPGEGTVKETPALFYILVIELVTFYLSLASIIHFLDVFHPQRVPGSIVPISATAYSKEGKCQLVSNGVTI
jgi:hypothetical protein